MIKRFYFGSLTAIAIGWFISDRSYKAAAMIVTAFGAIAANEYKCFVDRRRAKDPTCHPPDIDQLVSNKLKFFFGTHWKSIANTLAVIATLLFISFGVVTAVRAVAAWATVQKQKIYAWFDGMAKAEKQRQEEESRKLAEFNAVLKSVEVTDFEWITSQLSEEAQAQLVNKFNGHKYVVCSSFTIQTTEYPLRDFKILIRITSPSGTETEDVYSDTVYEEIPPHSSKSFPETRIGTCKLNTGKAAIRAIPKRESELESLYSRIRCN